jgi:hypothetical protein
VLTPSGWTREYIVTTVSNISRMVTRDKTIQTGKILVTCVVTIPGVGTHTGSDGKPGCRLSRGLSQSAEAKLLA